MVAEMGSRCGESYVATLAQEFNLRALPRQT